MFGSFHLGRIFGISIRVHWLYVAMVVFVLLFVAPTPSARLVAFGAILILSLVVLLHELGHSLVAKRFGIRVVDITFWPLGGMARMSEIPEDTKIESTIAIAGPAVNFVLVALTLPFASLPHILDMRLTAQGLTPFELAATYFVTVNLLLGVFNLIPAFPMDGGRVLRAWLGRNGDWVGATERAVRVGRVFAVLMVLVGLFSTMIFLPLIGVFVWFAGSRELVAVRMRHGRGILAQALGMAGFGERESSFAANAPRPAARPRPEPPPPTGPHDEHVGAARPEEWKGIGGPTERLSDEDIERLERYRGRL